MGTEYCLGNHGTIETSEGLGSSIKAYEMSDEFEVYVDVPKITEIEDFEDITRIYLWEKVTPIELLKIGINFINIANQYILNE